MHNPTPSDRALVSALSSCGIQQTKIAKHVGVAPKTLRAAYRKELNFGLEKAVAGAAMNMFRLATRDSMVGFKAAAHVLDHFGGPHWRGVKTPLNLKLPALRTIGDAQSALAAIITAAACGEILAGDALTLASIVGSFVKTVELSELETRLVALEQASAGGSPMERFNA